MKIHPFLFVLCSISFTAIAQLSLKVASSLFIQPVRGTGLLGSIVSQLLHPLTILAIIAYFGSLIFWILSLRYLPLSLAYPLSGLTIALVTLSGVLVLDERLLSHQVFGIILIIAGVLFLMKY